MHWLFVYPLVVESLALGPGVVALAFLGNTRSSIWVYVLGTGKVVMRDKFVGLPMTEEVIRKRNSLEVIQSLTFCYKDIKVGDEEPDVSGLDDQNPDQVLDGRGLHILNDVPVCIEVKRYVFVVDRVK